MPAKRSRTVGWRQCLEDLGQRDGAIEIAVARDFDDDGPCASHIMWRVRLLQVTDEEIVVEVPSTMGQTVPLNDDVQLIAIFSVGQNRWMFRTETLGGTSVQLNHRHTLRAVRLRMPEQVERCQRRNYYRIETTTLNLPRIQVWPLLDPKSVVLAERANEIAFEESLTELEEGHDPDPFVLTQETRPELGPKLTATLLNLGGGGMGLRVGSDQVAAFQRHRLFWCCIEMPEDMVQPIYVSAKLTHTHMDSEQRTYAGMAFDFSFNPGHQPFVVDQICRYIAEQQRRQLKRAAG